MYIGDLFRGGAYAGITTSLLRHYLALPASLLWNLFSPGFASTRFGASPQAKVYPNGRDPNAIRHRDPSGSTKGHCAGQPNQLDRHLRSLYDLWLARAMALGRAAGVLDARICVGVSPVRVKLGLR